MSDLKIFNNPNNFIEGWYWVLPSHKLRKKQIKAVNLLGRELAVYRGINSKVTIIDAYCPHMGAHLAEGIVEENNIRCLFHNWKFDQTGNCIEIPCLGKRIPIKVKTWPTLEQYGMIWVWTGEHPTHPLPHPTELKDQECIAGLGTHFIKNCHPNVVMINAIDAHHFNTVHNFPIEINFKKEHELNGGISFKNITKGGNDSLLIKLIRPFYKNEGTYNLTYWSGSTGIVTLGPDFLHFYIMFTLRLLPGGKTEGQTLLLTKKRPGILGWILNKIILFITQVVANYFAKGDTKIFQTIQFNLQTPIKADESILQFINHTEQQKALTWKQWELSQN